MAGEWENVPDNEGWETISTPKQSGIDYKSGIPNARFRAAFGFMSADSEKQWYLDSKIGQGNWGKDNLGTYYVKPEGLKRLGITSDKPVAIDESGFSRYDFADLAGDLPAIAGGIGMGTAATGVGALPGMALAGLGAAGGKAYSEVAKRLMGIPKSAEETAQELGGEALAGAAGEGLFRGGRAIGRKILGPGRAMMTPAKTELAEDAVKRGFRFPASSVTDSPILGRMQTMMRKVVGDPWANKNTEAAMSQMDELLKAAGETPVSSIQAGQAVRGAIQQSRKAFQETAEALYGQVDELAGNQPFVPTKPIKEVLAKYKARMPLDEAGNVVYPNAEIGKFIEKYSGLADAQTLSSVQQLRTTFREAAESRDLIPGLPKHMAGELKQAADKAFDLAADSLKGQSDVIAKLRTADGFYKQGIGKFDDALVSRLMRDSSFAGSVEPEQIVNTIVKKGMASRVDRIKQIVPEAQWQQVRRAHAEDITSSLIKNTDDPLIRTWDGKGFMDSLESYGRDTLEAVHGKAWTENAYGLAKALMLVQKEKKFGGDLVAASIALHPIQNFPKIAEIGRAHV